MESSKVYVDVTAEFQRKGYLPRRASDGQMAVFMRYSVLRTSEELQA